MQDVKSWLGTEINMSRCARNYPRNLFFFKRSTWDRFSLPVDNKNRVRGFGQHQENYKQKLSKSYHSATWMTPQTTASVQQKETRSFVTAAGGIYTET
jgi:hypothetical protein